MIGTSPTSEGSDELCEERRPALFYARLVEASFRLDLIANPPLVK